MVCLCVIAIKAKGRSCPCPSFTSCPSLSCPPFPLPLCRPSSPPPLPLTYCRCHQLDLVVAVGRIHEAIVHEELCGAQVGAKAGTHLKKMAVCGGGVQGGGESWQTPGGSEGR